MTIRPDRRLVLATTVWKRPELTDAVLANYKAVRQSLADRMDLPLLAVGSEGRQSREICERNGFEYVEYENEPVTYKWNAIISRAEALNPEGIILVNSDDLVSANLFGVYLDRLAEGFDYFGLRGTYVFDLMAEQLGTWPGYEASYMRYRVGEPAGCARCFSRRLLESTGWRLWPVVPRKNSSMDFWSTQFLKLYGFEPRAWTMDELGVAVVQLKTDVNITTFNRLPLSDLRSGHDAWRVIEEVGGAHTVEALRRFRSGLAAPPGMSMGDASHRCSTADREPVYRIEDIEPPSLRCQILAELRAMQSSVRVERENRQ